MLNSTQLEGLSDLLKSIDGAEESDNSLSRERMKRFIRVALEQGLTSKQGEVIRLIYIDGLKQKDAAKMLGMSPSAVSEMKKRALARMKKYAVFML